MPDDACLKLNLISNSAAPALGHAVSLTEGLAPTACIDLGRQSARILHGDMTIEWWQFMPNTDAAENQTVIAWQGPDEASSEKTICAIELRYSEYQSQQKHPRPHVTMTRADAQGSEDHVGDHTLIQPNRWYHIVIVRNAKNDTIRYYINGSPAGSVQDIESAAERVPPDGTVRITIGQEGEDGPPAFRGSLDEIAIYDHALTDERIMTHFRTALKSSQHTDGPTVVAHRGVNRFAPENTRVSYEQAIAVGAPIVEMDLHRSKEGVIVLMHDDTLERTTNGTGRVNDKTLSELKTLDAGSWKDAKYAGEPVPTLEEIAELCRGQTVMMLDLKDPVRGDEIAPVMTRMNIRPDQVIIAPWHTEQAKDLKPYLPDVPMILLHSQLPEGHEQGDAFFEQLKQMGFSGFSLNWTHLTQAFVQAAHRHGMKVYTWTLNAPEDISGTALMGVDGIVTDDPAATAKHISDLQQ